MPRANVALVSNIADTILQPKFFYFLAKLTESRDPNTFKEAVTRMQWVAAKNKELDALEQNVTWEVRTLPLDKTASSK